ncbi:MAG: ADP-ribosylglycohydrolase family protein [Nannocystaceae bacterium]
MLDTHTRSSRIKGSLYGLLVGDALGCPVEGWSPMRIERQFGVLAMMEVTGRPRGLHSDDGQQTVALCDAILDDPANPAPGFAQHLVDLYIQGPRDRGRFGHHRGTGKNFRNTVEKLAGNAGLYEASMPSAGNGNAMLIAPASWFWSNDLETLLTKVIDISLVKQHNICGVASAAAVAHIVAHAIENGSLDSYHFPNLLEYVRACEQRTYERLVDRGLVDAPNSVFSSALRRALEIFDLPRQEVLQAIAAIANETADRKVYATSGYSVASVLTSLYFALSSTSLFDAIVDTVNLGGDADTTGAMVGSIVGAAAGYEAIPGEWLAELVARGSFDDRVEPMTMRIAGWRPARSLVELEAQWTARWPAQERPSLGPLWQHAKPSRQMPGATPPVWEKDEGDEEEDTWENPDIADVMTFDGFGDDPPAPDDDDDDDDDPWETNDNLNDPNDPIAVDEDALNEALQALGGKPLQPGALDDPRTTPTRSGPFPRPLLADLDVDPPKKVYRQRNRGWSPRPPRLERHNSEEQPCPPQELGEALHAIACMEYAEVFGKPWAKEPLPRVARASGPEVVPASQQTGTAQGSAAPSPQATTNPGPATVPAAPSHQRQAVEADAPVNEPNPAQFSLFPDLE